MRKIEKQKGTEGENQSGRCRYWQRPDFFPGKISGEKGKTISKENNLVRIFIEGK